jgi:hypothetical protein
MVRDVAVEVGTAGFMSDSVGGAPGGWTEEKVTDHHSGSGVGVSALQELIVKWREFRERGDKCPWQQTEGFYRGLKYAACDLEAVLSSLQPPEKANPDDLREDLPCL